MSGLVYIKWGPIIISDKCDPPKIAVHCKAKANVKVVSDRLNNTNARNGINAGLIG